MSYQVTRESQIVPYKTSDLPPSPWLVFAPHPDDETFGMGGTLLLAKDQGVAVSLVVFTDGAFGEPTSRSDLAATREAEAREVAAQLGMQDVQFWRERDRGLYVTEPLVERIAAQVETSRPASVFFPSPMELHPDHRTSGALVWQGLQRAGFCGRAYAYEITVQTRINYLIDITSVASKKEQLMSVYASQVTDNRYRQLVEALDVTRTFTLPPYVQRAEGFFAFPAGCPGPLAAQTIAGLQPFFRTDTETKLPLVSVIVRTRDRPHLLQEAIQSAVVQTYPHLELVVVNDGGQDVSGLIEPFGQLISKLDYLALPEGPGRAAAANAGLDRATGDYVTFLDDDDLLDPTHIADLVEALRTHPDYRLAYTGVRQEGGTGPKTISRAYDPVKLRMNNLFPIHAAMFDRDLLDAGCRFDERLTVFEDWDFWLQLAEVTDFLHLDQISATYRRSGASGANALPFDPAVAAGARAMIYEKWSKRWSGSQMVELFEALREDRANALQRILSSESYRIGYWLTFPLRWLKQWWRRLRHGL